MKKPPPRYKGEQTLMDELKELTERTRKLREELRDMVSSPKPQDLTRSLLHTQSWTRERPKEQSATANDRRRKNR